MNNGIKYRSYEYAVVNSVHALLLGMTIFPDGMGSCGITSHLGRDWDIFLSHKKNLGTGVILFLSQLHMRDGSVIDKFCPIPSYCWLRMKILPIGMGSYRIPSIFRRDWNIFLSQKNIRTGLRYFFISFAYTGHDWDWWDPTGSHLFLDGIGTYFCPKKI